MVLSISYLLRLFQDALTGRLQNIEDVRSHALFEFFECDVSAPNVLELEAVHGVSEIYHLASPASPVFYQSAPFDTIAANTIGTQQMLELARKNHARFLYASTSEAYGDPTLHPQPEEYCGNVNTWGLFLMNLEFVMVILQAMRARWVLMTTIPLLCVACAAYISYFVMVPTYEATSRQRQKTSTPKSGQTIVIRTIFDQERNDNSVFLWFQMRIRCQSAKKRKQQEITR